MPGQDDATHAYDVRTLVKAFDLLRAAGQLQAFLAWSEERGLQVHVPAELARHGATQLNALIPELLDSHPGLVEETVVPERRTRLAGGGDCPLCPRPRP